MSPSTEGHLSTQTKWSAEARWTGAKGGRLEEQSLLSGRARPLLSVSSAQITFLFLVLPLTFRPW